MVNWRKMSLVLLIGLVIVTGYGGLCGSTDVASNSGSSGVLGPQPPLFNAIADQVVAEGATLTIVLSATDPDSVNLTYSVYNLPAGASFTASTHTFTWVPAYNQAGSYSTIRFRVTDETGLYAEKTITVTVQDANVPNAPTNLAANIVSASEISLTWSNNSTDETIFKVERKIGTSGNYTQIGQVTVNIVTYSDSGLVGGTQYYYRVRAYAATGNSAYSNEVLASTTALNIAPTVVSAYPTEYSHNSAALYAILNPNGLATTAYFEWGTTTAYGNQTSAQTLGNSTTSVNITASLSGLNPSTAYNFRLVATNSQGTSLGQNQTLTTTATPTPPTATTTVALNAAYNSVSLTGIANPNGFSADVYFQWGTTTSYTNTTLPQAIGSGISDVNVTENLISILANTTYHYRAVASNNSGTVFGQDQQFTTPAGPPTVLTNPASNIDFSSATLNGTVNPNSLPTDIYFQWGAATSYGNTTLAQSVGNSTGYVNVTKDITGLTTNGTYNFRLVASNSSGTTYGLNQSFTAVTDVKWTTIVGAENHTVGLKNDGTVWTWGDSTYGQLGLGDNISRTIPTQVGTDTAWSKVAVGSGYTAALKTNGTLWGWGDNAEGQLGLGNTVTSVNTPTQVGTGTDWTSIAAGGHSHTVATKSSGALYAWGDNVDGQLGLGDTTNRYNPTLVSDTGWATVSAGYSDTTAVRNDGTLWAWGGNNHGQLGVGDVITRTEPAQVGTDNNWTKVTSGGEHTAGIKDDGTIWVWGDNANGQLGLGDTVTRTEPTVLSGSGWTDISLGQGHTIAKKTDGTIWAWGDNANGQLGLGDLVTRTAPTLVLTDTDWSSIGSGWNYSIGVKGNGDLFAWGANNDGQLGIGDNVDRGVPFYVPEGQETWINMANMPTPRYYHAIGVVNNKIYVIGGWTGGSSLATNEEYNPATNLWTTKTPMPTARNAFAIGVVNGKIYAIGGTSNGLDGLVTNEEYDPATNSWTTKSPMPTARWFLEIAVVNNKIYAFGGRTQIYTYPPIPATSLGILEEYDPVTDMWVTKAPAPSTRWGFAIGVVNNKIYAIGGYVGANIISNTNEMYDPTTNLWITKIPMLVARPFHDIGVVNGKIYAIGGGTYSSANEEYNPTIDSWTAKMAMPTPRRVRIGVANNKIYAIGGWNGNELTINEQYTPGSGY